MADINLGRVKGTMWYVGTSNDSASIVSEIKALGKTPLENDVYLNTSTGDIWVAGKGGTTFTKNGNIKGPQGTAGTPGAKGDAGTPGAKGDTGATPSITMSATSDGTHSSSPSVKVTKGGTDEAPTFTLAFTGLMGATGPKGDTGADGATGPAGPTGSAGKDGVTPSITATATVGSTTGTPSVKVTKGGTAAAPSFEFAFSNLKGDKGEKGDKGNAGSDGSVGPAGPAGANGKTPSFSINASGELIATFED